MIAVYVERILLSRTVICPACKAPVGAPCVYLHERDKRGEPMGSYHTKRILVAQGVEYPRD